MGKLYYFEIFSIFFYFFLKKHLTFALIGCIIYIQSRETLVSKRKEFKTLGNKKNNRKNDLTVAKLLIVKAVIEMFNVMITLITKIIDTTSN